MGVPGLGEVSEEQGTGWYYSQPLALAVLNGAECRIVLEAYADDERKADYHAAIANFLSASADVLKEAEAFIYAYYQDARKHHADSDAGFPRIASPDGVWAHIEFGNEPTVSRRLYGDRGIYISLECACDWEPEHGLQIVFKNGGKICKVGPYDGHLTNADAYADDTLEHVIYRRLP